MRKRASVIFCLGLNSHSIDFCRFIAGRGADKGRDCGLL